MTDRRSLVSVTTFAAAALAFMTLGCAAVEAEPLNGQQLAFDRSKGNCLTCHEIKGGDAAGNIGPPLADVKSRFPERKDLVAIISDETTRNPETVMPPFRRNLILNDAEIQAIVDFLYTL